LPKDFSCRMYLSLINAFKQFGYSFIPFVDFISVEHSPEKCVVLRHDVDRLPKNALTMAELEYGLGIKASYYFRIVNKSFDENIIKNIVGMGHEIGYHYENLSEISKEKGVKGKEEFLLKGRINRFAWISRMIGWKQLNVECGKRKDKLRNELFQLAIVDFRLNLDKLRKFYPVKTICMHGSPFSKWDNRDLWKKYDYRDFGIIGEPYFDIDYNEVFYITDTGRMWNNESSSVRDRVESGFDISIRDTAHLIELIEQSLLPRKIMINIHPQRWTNHFFPWVKEFLWQNVKNLVKRGLLKEKIRRLCRMSELRDERIRRSADYAD